MTNNVSPLQFTSVTDVENVAVEQRSTNINVVLLTMFQDQDINSDNKHCPCIHVSPSRRLKSVKLQAPVNRSKGAHTRESPFYYAPVQGALSNDAV